jgi:hypothetical protein
VAHQLNQIEIGFEITDHPFLKYKKEDRVDLEHAYRTDILHGAFMGDVILRLPGADFSTPPANHGWRGLVEWCLRLDAAVSSLSSGATEHRMSEPDGNDWVLIRGDHDDLIFTSSTSAEVGRIARMSFLRAAEAFIRHSVLWVGEHYPAAKRNRESTDIWTRLDAYL